VGPSPTGNQPHWGTRESACPTLLVLSHVNLFLIRWRKMLRMAKLRPILLAAGGLALLAIAAISNAQHTGYDPALWSGLHYRMIGPERGGRVTAVTGVPSQPYTFYMGSTGGGVWKTLDAGHTWSNISDGYFSVASMGAIEVSLSNPDIVYAAPAPRRSAAMFRSGAESINPRMPGRPGPSPACAIPGKSPPSA